MALTFSRITFAVLFGAGAWTIQYFARTNNLFHMMASYKNQRILPHTETSFDATCTGIKVVDEVLALLLMFFWNIFDGKNPALSLASLAFCGQVVAAWTLTVVEGVRQGNAWKVVSFTGVVGMLGQLMGLGVVAPAYFLIYTFTSPIMSTPTPKLLSPSLCASLAAIPAAVTISYIIPIALMPLPVPEYLTFTQKMAIHHTWQVFPITTSLTHFVLSWMWPYNPAPTPKNVRGYLRFVYKFALTFAVPAHLTAGTITTSAYLLPNLFNPSLAPLLRPEVVWLPGLAAFKGHKATSVPEGGLWFIQWDYIFVGTSYLFFGIMTRQSARRFLASKEGFGITGVLKVGVRTAILGPVGAAVCYVWERDEAVFEAAEVAAAKKTM